MQVLAVLVGRAGRGQRNREEIGAEATDKPAVNTAAKRLRMRQVEHFRSLFQSHFPVKVSRALSASFCAQLVVQLFCFMLLVFLTIL